MKRFIIGLASYAMLVNTQAATTNNAPKTVGQAIIIAACVTGTVIIGVKIDQWANSTFNFPAFPAQVNSTAPYWPLNRANINGKKQLGLGVDATGTGTHKKILRPFPNPNDSKGLAMFTDIYHFKVQAWGPGMKSQGLYDAVVWAASDNSFVMLYCGNVSCGSDCTKIFCVMPDVGTEAYLQAVK